MESNGGIIGEYAIPTPAGGARCITAIADGRLFFTQYDVGMIGEIIFSVICITAALRHRRNQSPAPLLRNLRLLAKYSRSSFRPND